MELTLPAPLTHSKLKASHSPPPLPLSVLSLSLFLVHSQTKAASVIRTQGALAKLKSDSACLSVDHRFSNPALQLQIQINTLRLSPPAHWCGFSIRHAL